jgi:putative aminopeptidase FrvX
MSSTLPAASVAADGTDSSGGIPPLLYELLSAAGPSGYEGAPARVWRASAESFARVGADATGSSVARVPGRDASQRLAIVGHIDEIGLIVTHIDDDGFLWFRSVGGWDPQILVGQRVHVSTSSGAVAGVIGKKATHLLRDEERKKVPELRELNIDIGARDGDQARGLVRVGDVAVIDAQPVSLPNGRVASRAMDNRLGAYVALEAARLVAERGGGECEVIAVAAAQEEVSFAGSQTSAYALEPSLAIAVDVTHATDTPGSDLRASGPHRLGSGAVIGRGATLHPRLFELLCETAEAESIPYTVEASGRTTGTDADVLHLSRAGVATGVVSIPLRYMHSPVELVQLDDVRACIRLIAGLALRLPNGISFER